MCVSPFLLLLISKEIKLKSYWIVNRTDNLPSSRHLTCNLLPSVFLLHSLALHVTARISCWTCSHAIAGQAGTEWSDEGTRFHSVAAVPLPLPQVRPCPLLGLPLSSLPPMLLLGKQIILGRPLLRKYITNITIRIHIGTEAGGERAAIRSRCDKQKETSFVVPVDLLNGFYNLDIHSSACTTAAALSFVVVRWTRSIIFYWRDTSIVFDSSSSSRLLSKSSRIQRSAI